VASRNRRNITRSGTPKKSHSAYPCEVAGGSSSVEPWDDSPPAEALGSLATRIWRPGGTLRIAALVLAEATYAVMAPRSAAMRGLVPRAGGTSPSPAPAASLAFAGSLAITTQHSRAGS
jgi:hypothetical protein